jgi:hypothetical protein
MKTIYHCELCINQSENKREIEKCEAKGIFDGSFYLPGTMFAYNHNEEFVGIFAIPEDCPKPGSSNTHIGNLPYWACRANGCGDSLDHSCCGDLVGTGKKGLKEWVKYHDLPTKFTKHETFDRMVKHLNSKGITPQIL